jgi:hypothetical protein
MKSPRRLTVLLSLSMVVPLALTRGAWAAPTAPWLEWVGTELEANFTGDQSAGIWPASYWSCPPVVRYHVYDLTGAITPAANTPGIRLFHQAANGPNGEWQLFGPTDGGPGGAGASLTVDFDSPIFGIFTSGLNAPGIQASSAGGNGGSGGSAGGIWVVAGNGGLGGTGGTVTVSSDGSIQTDGSSGIRASSSGGAGGNGGVATVGVLDAQGGHGGTGGAGGIVAVTSGSGIETAGTSSAGIAAWSRGGAGGNGGWGEVAVYALGGQGGVGGAGGPVTVINSAGIHTSGASSSGIAAESQGGAGGVGGNSGGIYGQGGAGGAGGSGSGVTVLDSGSIETTGASSSGIAATSQGGAGGVGGAAGGAYGKAGAGGAGGGGGLVTVQQEGSIVTTGESSSGIVADSLGGVGGAGRGAGGAYGAGGAGGTGGSGGDVVVNASGSIETEGDSSAGIFARSQGGIGGAGGVGGGVYGAGGAGGVGGSAGHVHVIAAGSSSITTLGAEADGISAQSLGGAGGNGGTGGGVWGQGGGALGSGPGGTVVVENAGVITTSGTGARGIFAESIGGFGGASGIGGGVVGWGGSGNSAGDGGAVTVTNSGTITTTGDSGERLGGAIYARSTGGGGGDAAGSGGLIAMGGTGFASGDGGTVTVTNYGPLQTLGSDTYGIMAQSIGGGGGSGGNAYGLGAVGGTENSTGDGKDVTVTNWGTVTTAGAGSHSILAQSVGGGGGVTAGHAGAAYSPLFSWGGTGAAGGSASTVTVHNYDNLATSGVDASGILAQSIGGGGGAGGGSYAVGLQFAITLGGNSAVGGQGGRVDVDSSTGSTIITEGGFSHGIHAQSVGGGGGDGGNAFTATAGLEIDGGLSIGGQGSGGGDGAAVNLANGSTITTQGEYAHGLYAQSIGGGGGSGGEAVTWTAVLGVESPGLSLPLTLGGAGAAGGKGGTVTVNSTGDISTSGLGSHGILAQSVGGGGGGGGNSAAGSFSINTMVENIAVGGNGEVGGNGDGVEVDSRGAIETDGDFASGILAQSLGGGGGSGGNSTTLTAALSIPTGVSWEDLLPSPSMQVDLSVGGGGAGGGAGGRVDVSTTADPTTPRSILTRGSFANGVLAQSIGGGGGVGGDSKAAILEFSLDPTDLLYGDLISPSISLLLGGSGGLGGGGGEVIVDNRQDIATEGHFANGILAQSVGGGGGLGGDVTKTSLSLGFSGMPSLPEALGLTVNNSFDLKLGGTGGKGGKGAAVTVDNLGDVTTTGHFANGILAQSIGGGGGVGGDVTENSVAVVDFPLEAPDLGGSSQGVISLGGLGGDGGNGGTVTVRNHGAITTEGDFANGILAQSIGGGGGVAGSLRVNSRLLVDPGNPSSLVLTGSGAGIGNGGAVTVENSGDISTHGRFAHGILAQSVGGGGGFGGISEETPGDGGPGVSTLAAGLKGTSMQNTGSGVGFAGSAGGSGAAGAVTVTHITGSIRADGVDSHGILAQSVGGSGLGGNITVNINSGTVRGGSGAGAGVNLDGGAHNVLTNSGSISALSGRAVRGSGGDDIINNNGLIVGQVLLGAGANAFNNNAGGRFDAGPLIDLGAGNDLTNAGTLSPGGMGVVSYTTLIGNLIQEASGILEIDIGGFAPGESDFLEIQGTLTSGPGILAGAPGILSLSLASTLGGVNFSFLPGFDPAAQLGPGETLTLEFLDVDNPDGFFASDLAYNVLGGPGNLRYDMFGQDNKLFLEVARVVPAPGALLLAGMGLTLLACRRPRSRA